MDSSTTYWLYDLWGSGASDLFVVGEQGTILRRKGW